MSERWATFDCYGTLIDWNGGIRRELARIFGDDRADDQLLRYHEIEPQVQAEDPSRSYREVMALTLERLGAPAEERDALGRALPSWDVFPEVPAALGEARSRGWRLCILSNTDRDFIDASMQTIGVPFDRSIVASEIGSYKPAHGHWRAFEREVGRLPDAHVCASLFHDVAPARELGVPSVWVNRLGEQPERDREAAAEPQPPSPSRSPAAPSSRQSAPTREVVDLSTLPDVLAELVPE